MDDTGRSRAVRLGGVAAMAGGTCWMVFAWFAALSPPYGAGGNLDNRFLAEDAWLLAALPLLGLGAWALDRVQREAVTTAGRVGAGALITGAVIASASLVLEALGLVVMERPLFEIGARVLLIPSGGILLAWAAFRAGSVPREAAGILLLGSGLLYIANSENWMAGLAAVFGLGWVTVGAALSMSRSEGHPTAEPHDPQRSGRT